ncbi:unnamed protein product [Phytomonas sp. Hart1]|nr:unnamed protein product [Phytomonas sp. Hart1]|eukprot:CCW68181.1 unnamed protein product [Phytomonas sp. isolate Hart1]
MTAAFPESHEKAQTIYRYIVKRFIVSNVDGTVRWNENVQIDYDEEEEAPQGAEAEASEEATSPRGASSAGKGEMTAARLVLSRAATVAAPVVEQPWWRMRAVASNSTKGPRTHAAHVDAARRMMQNTRTQPSSSSRYGLNYNQPVPFYADLIIDPEAEFSSTTFEHELRRLFKKYDVKKLGYLDRDDFKRVYTSLENYGLEPSQADIERLFTRYSKSSKKIFFDEFCVLMLQRVHM